MIGHFGSFLGNINLQVKHSQNQAKKGQDQTKNGGKSTPNLILNNRTINSVKSGSPP